MAGDLFVGRILLIILLVVVMVSGCLGGAPETPPETTGAPVETTQAPATTQPPVTTAPPTQPPTQPPTTAPPAPILAKYDLPTTSFSDLLPADVSKVEPMGGDYDAVLKFPVNVGTKVDDVKASYGIQASYGQAAGVIYILKYGSLDEAADFFNQVIEKNNWKGTPLTEKTLSSGGKSLTIYHSIEFKKYVGTIFRRGLFVFYVKMTTDDIGAEQYVSTNFKDLFDGEQTTKPVPLVTKNIDFSNAATNLRDIIPEGGKVETQIPNTEYLYTLNYPNKPGGYASDIKSTYTVPAGNIYVSKLSSTTDAELFLSAALSKYSSRGNAPVRKVISRDGKSLVVYHVIETAYKGTIIHNGLFVYYVAVGKDDFDAEFYISRKLGYLFQ